MIRRALARIGSAALRPYIGSALAIAPAPLAVAFCSGGRPAVADRGQRGLPIRGPLGQIPEPMCEVVALDIGDGLGNVALRAIPLAVEAAYERLDTGSAR